MRKIIPVIMSGGAGSRLWPLSRQDMPKQLLPLTSEKTMVQETALRFQGPEFTDPVFVCNANHVEAISRQMAEIGQTVGAFIVEPMGRNTAPCAVTAALYASALGPDHLILLAPADHHISDVAAFKAAIKLAEPVSRAGFIVTFGIHPQGPETGYGYIAAGEAITKGVNKVAAFREKPDAATAKTYLAQGNYTWNAGIFLFTPDLFLKEIQTYAPEIARRATAAYTSSERSGNIIRLDKDSFAACPADSIDYAVMEKSSFVAVTPCAMGWNDIGSYQSLHDLLKNNLLKSTDKDKADDGNVAFGQVMRHGTKNCYISTDSLPVSIVGAENMAVIVRGGEILVLNLNASQDVKKIVEKLKTEGAKNRL